MAREVTAYIDSAPEEQRPVLVDLRRRIKRQLPKLKEQMSPNGFALYTVGEEWVAGFAYRKKRVMLYIMQQAVLDAHENTLGKLRSGKSCVVWKASKDLTLPELEELADQMLREAGEAAS